MKNRDDKQNRKHLEKFISKLAKPLSEFVILSIIAENPRIHTYEIHSHLLNRFQHSSNPIIHSLTVIMEIIDSTIKTNGVSINDMNRLKEIPLIHLRDPFIKLLNSLQLDDTVISTLIKIQQDLESVNLINSSSNQIWMTSTGIYQTMIDLEKFNLVTVCGQEIVNGRTRKLYEITDHGRSEAVKMLFTFISLNNFVLPINNAFSVEITTFFNTHESSFQSLIERLDIDQEVHRNMFQANSNFALNNPLLLNKFNLIIQNLLFRSNSEDNSEKASVIMLNQTTKDDLLITKLKNFKNKIDTLIDQLEKLPS